MKLLVLAALVVVVSSGQHNVNQNQQPGWPWQVGKLYRYDLETHTLARYQESNSTGNSFRAQFIVRVKSPGNLQARLDHPEYAQVHQTLEHHEPMPDNLNYQPVPNLDKPFEIQHENGRVVSVKLPYSVSLSQENLIKGLVGALQVDLSSHRNVKSSQNTYDSNVQQGLFRKMEIDVTGDCETQYSVSPVAAEWRREVPNFASDDQPLEITKSKNYGHCHHRVDYHFGVPEGAEWSGTAHKRGKEQAINRATVSRMLVGQNGPIYKAETTSTVTVHPHLYGEKKAEVHGKVHFNLVSYEQDTEAEWQKPEGAREIKNLLYSLTAKPVASDDNASFEKHVNIESNSRQKVVSINKKIVTNSHDSSSSSESNSAYVNDDIPKFNEPAYASLYLNPQPHGDKKQNPMNAQKLVQEIAQQLQNPNNIPKADLLSKFNILVRIVSSMSYGQLSQTSRSIEVAKSSNNIVKSNMWMIYRDAVTQSGTLPAFQQIKSWIESKKLEGEEAAQVISALAKSLRYPSKEVMKQFFELAMNPAVTNQEFLNSSALNSATKLINMGQVNNETAHRYYPTHIYGRQSPQEDHFVVDEVLPRLSQELQRAIENGDSRKSQVYIKAIGNLGHPAILNVFAPYLEGKNPNPLSTYLRTAIVENLRELAYERNNNARAVLFSILKNTAEPYEVRVAAAHNIFMSRPTTAMMMTMAQMTKDDPSTHVRAVLKSAINSAAQLKNPHFYDLARTAAAAKDMLTSEEFGLQYSTKKYNEYDDRDEQPGIMSIFSSIGSKNSLIPKYLRYASTSRTEGWEESSFTASASNVQQLFDLFADQIYGQRNADQNAENNHKYSAEKIANMLNIQGDDKESLEASISVNLMNQRRHFAFDENKVQNLGSKLGEYLTNLNNGVENHYTKVVNKNQVSIMFPIASGVPFIYKYKEPTLVHVQAKAKGKIDFSNRDDYKTAGSINSELKVIYAENHEGNVGFLDTLGNQLANVGLVRKIQLNIPVKMNLEMKSGEVKFNLSPMEPEQDSTIAHYSVWPYSANQKRDTLSTIAQDPTTILITRPEKVSQIDNKFGQHVGSTFQLQGYSYSEDYRNIGNMLKSHNYISSISAAFKQNDIAQTHFNLKYLGKQSKNKGVSISAAYDTLYNQNNEGEMSLTANNVKDASPNSQSRRDELVKRVVTGIKSARAHVVDLSAKFDSPKNLEYALTFAIGESHVDPKIQYALYAGRNSDQYGPNQINAVGRLTKPMSIAPFNLHDALQNDLKTNFEADIRYNEKENIHIQGSAQRTEKYVEDLQKDPIAQRCLEDAAGGNYYQRDCHQILVKAHVPNNLKLTVTYKDVSAMTKNVAYQVNKIIEGLSLWRSEMNTAKVQPNGKLEINVEASHAIPFPSKTLNLVINSRSGELRVNNVPLPEVASRIASAYWPFSASERVLNYYSGHQYQPYCSVEKSQVRTFSDRNYNYNLSSSWHLMVYDHRPGSNEDLVVLSRRNNGNQLMTNMYISYRSHTGKHMEIELEPPHNGQPKDFVKVNTNAKKVSAGELTTYWDDVDEIPILEYYNLSDNVVMLKLGENRLRVLYDGTKSVVLANNNRGNVRGICGRMSGEPRDDYNTPSGLIDNPEYYGASYALVEGDNDPQTKQWQSEGKRMAYQPQNQYSAILPSHGNWGQNIHDSSEEDNGNQIIYRTRNYVQNKEPCKVIPQVQYYENQLQICITTTALPACQSHCSGNNHKVRAAQVVCQPKSDHQFQSYRDQIKLGQSPKVSGVPQITQYRVPNSCKA